MRLIDSDKIMYSKSDCNLRPFEYAFRAQLEALPAVDAVPVVHGSWIPIEHIEENICKCLICNYPISGWHKTNYCPNCGARMDGKCDDNENR